VKYTERAITFGCAQDTLVGIVAVPMATATTAVVVVVGGPQYRAGSHRQFVYLSRELAAAGYPVLRFDYRGMGDSSGDKRDFLQATADIGAAIDALQRELPTVQRLVLWGLCDGASAALLYCHNTGDPRISGLCLLNPWVRSEASLARAHVKHYYADRLRQKEFWRKLISGNLATSALVGLLKNVRMMSTQVAPDMTQDTSFQGQMLAAWQRFRGPILLVLSGEDYTAKEFSEFAAADAAWQKALTGSNVTRQEVSDADHTFAQATARQHVAELTRTWLGAGQAQ